MLADVAKASCAEQRIDHRVGHGIGIAVPMQPAAPLEHDPAEHKLACGVVAEAMNIETLPNSRHRFTLPCLQVPALLYAPTQIVWVGDLTVVFSSHDD